MNKQRVLVICVHNSARSQMAEEYLRLYGGDIVAVESAGLEPGAVNPIVVELLREDGIDISGKNTRSVHELHKSGRAFDYVIAVCDPEARDACPVFPAERRRLHWPFPDPSAAAGTREEQAAFVRGVRDDIRRKAAAFVEELRAMPRTPAD